MTFTPIAPTNMDGEFDNELLQWSERICMKSATLVGGHNQHVIDELKELLRITNSYYSNRIESDGTHPINIEKAMRKEFSDDQNEQKLQKLSVAHIYAQQKIDQLIADGISPFDSSFVKLIHYEMYSQDGMDKFLNIMSEDSGEIVKMTPGKFRTWSVAVGDYVAPPAEEIESLTTEYAHLYGLAYRQVSIAKKFLYALSSHHRLVWIHPFLDGNGRVSRLVLDGAIISSGISGYGLWNISRGLAKHVDDYKKHLKHADMKRQGAYDGRGDLSLSALRDFVVYMLTIAEDQIDFMGDLLNMDGLTTRIETYVTLANSGVLGIEEFPKGSVNIFKYLLIHGESPRGKMADVIGAKDRTTTNVIKELLKRNFLSSPSLKGPVRLKFTAHMGSYIFPDLLPIMPNKDIFIPKKRAGRPKLAQK